MQEAELRTKADGQPRVGHIDSRFIRHDRDDVAAGNPFFPPGKIGLRDVRMAAP